MVTARDLFNVYQSQLQSAAGQPQWVGGSGGGGSGLGTATISNSASAASNTWLFQNVTPTSTASVWASPTVAGTPTTFFISGPMRAPDPVFDDDGSGHYRLRVGHRYMLRLPDDAYIAVEKDGSYAFVERDAKVVYKAAPRNFNQFLSASDRIEEFVKFCGQHGVRRHEMLKLPLELFIVWLVIEAAKADGEPEPNIPLLPMLKRYAGARCRSCGRFMRRAASAKGITVCRVECFEAEMALAIA